MMKRYIDLCVYYLMYTQNLVVLAILIRHMERACILPTCLCRGRQEELPYSPLSSPECLYVHTSSLLFRGTSQTFLKVSSTDSKWLLFDKSAVKLHRTILQRVDSLNFLKHVNNFIWSVLVARSRSHRAPECIDECIQNFVRWSSTRQIHKGLPIMGTRHQQAIEEHNAWVSGMRWANT